MSLNKIKSRKTSRKRITKKNHEAISEATKNDNDIIDIENDETPLISDLDNDESLGSDTQLENYTLAELADLALPYSNRSIETLKRLKREELIYIITNKKDDYRAKEYSNLANDTKDIIELFIEILSDYKKKREGRELNALLVKILRKQDKKINESLIKIGASGGIISYSLFFVIVIGCFIDAFIGFDNLFEKIKKRPTNVEKQQEQKA